MLTTVGTYVVGAAILFSAALVCCLCAALGADGETAIQEIRKLGSQTCG
jgi:hypothetical protein